MFWDMFVFILFYFIYFICLLIYLFTCLLFAHTTAGIIGVSKIYISYILKSFCSIWTLYRMEIILQIIKTIQWKNTFKSYVFMSCSLCLSLHPTCPPTHRCSRNNRNLKTRLIFISGSSRENPHDSFFVWQMYCSSENAPNVSK